MFVNMWKFQDWFIVSSQKKPLRKYLISWGKVILFPKSFTKRFRDRNDFWNPNKLSNNMQPHHPWRPCVRVHLVMYPKPTKAPSIGKPIGNLLWLRVVDEPQLSCWSSKVQLWCKPVLGGYHKWKLITCGSLRYITMVFKNQFWYISKYLGTGSDI
jgi:hypothetical protein